MSTPSLGGQHEYARIETRVVLSALWITTLIEFACVDFAGTGVEVG
jgi:hypothetical protein